MVQEARHGENFVAIGAVGRTDLEASLDHLLEVFGKMSTDRVILSCGHFAVQSLHCGSTERRLLHCHLVKNASNRPNVTSEVIRHVLPYFGASIIGSSSLSAEKSTFAYF